MGWLDKSKNNSKNETNDTPVVISSEVKGKSKPKGDGMGTIIGPGLEIVGHLTAEEDVYIAGKIKGEVTCRKKITVAANGLVEGKVKCHSMDVFGVINGDVNASNLIKIEKSGKIIGDIRTKLFINEPGGFFEGYSHMAKETEPKKDEKGVQQLAGTSKNKRKGS